MGTDILFWFLHNNTSPIYCFLLQMFYFLNTNQGRRCEYCDIVKNPKMVFLPLHVGITEEEEHLDTPNSRCMYIC